MGTIQRADLSIEERWDAAGRETLLTAPRPWFGCRCCAPARHRAGAGYGGLHQRLPRLAARRLRPRAVEAEGRLAEARIHFEPG
jgi:hypothetical protein